MLAPAGTVGRSDNPLELLLGGASTKEQVPNLGCGRLRKRTFNIDVRGPEVILEK